MSTCSHGVPRMYHCDCDKAHPHPPDHVCDDPTPRISDFDSVERRIVMALIAGGKEAKTAKAG